MFPIKGNKPHDIATDSGMLREAAKFLIRVNPDNLASSDNDVSSMPNLRHALTMAHWALEQKKPDSAETESAN